MVCASVHVLLVHLISQTPPGQPPQCAGQPWPPVELDALEVEELLLDEVDEPLELALLLALLDAEPPPLSSVV